MSENEQRKLCWLLLLLVVLVVNLASFPKRLYPCDPYWLRFQVQAWLDGRGDVPAEYAVVPPIVEGQFFFRNPRNGGYYVKYGPAAALFMAPPVYLWNKMSGYTIWDVANWYQAFIKKNPALALEYNLSACPYSPSLLYFTNHYNLLWSLILASILYWSALHFCKRPILCVIWVLATLFAGFGWNYLRAQTYEIGQWTAASLFFTCSAYMLNCIKEERRIPALLWLGAWLGVGSLILMRSSYIVLLPVWLAVTLWPSNSNHQPNNHVVQEKKAQQNSLVNPIKEFMKRCLDPWVWLPVVLIMTVFLGCNYWRFGGIFCTGYTQWSVEATPLSNNPLIALHGFLFRPDKSIFLHQPLLIFSLFAIPSFFKRFPRIAWLICLSFLVNLLLISKYVGWHGDACYGPRHLIFILSQLTWPSLLLLDYLWDNWPQLKCKICSIILVFVLGVSFYFQTRINSLDFYTYYKVEGFLSWIGASDNVLSTYRERYWGLVCNELIALRDRGEKPYWLQVLEKENPKGAKMVKEICVDREMRDN